MKAIPPVRPVNKHCGCQRREWRSCIVHVCSQFIFFWDGIKATLLSGRRTDRGTIVCVSLNMSRCSGKLKIMPYWLFWTASPAAVQFCQHLQLQLLDQMKVNLKKHSETQSLITSSIWHRGHSRDGRCPARNACTDWLKEWVNACTD